MNDDKYNRYINPAHMIDDKTLYVYKNEENLFLKIGGLNHQMQRLNTWSSIKTIKRSILRSKLFKELSLDDDT